MPDVKAVKVNGKEYQFQVATLGRMRQAAQIETEIAGLLGKMLEDEGYKTLVAKWNELMGVILVGGSEIDPDSTSVAELTGAKAGFFGQATPKP